MMGVRRPVGRTLATPASGKSTAAAVVYVRVTSPFSPFSVALKPHSKSKPLAGQSRIDFSYRKGMFSLPENT